MPLRGTFTISLSINHTIEIPSVFLPGFPGSLAVVACAAHIGLYPLDVWENFEREVLEWNDMHVLHYFLLNAKPIEIDSCGRLTLPADFCHQACLDTGVDNTIVIGSDECLELWSREKFARYGI